MPLKCKKRKTRKNIRKKECIKERRDIYEIKRGISYRGKCIDYVI